MSKYQAPNHAFTRPAVDDWLSVQKLPIVVLVKISRIAGDGGRVMLMLGN